MSKLHWSDYAPVTGWTDRYRHCRRCNRVWLNAGYKPLIRNGRKS